MGTVEKPTELRRQATNGVFLNEKSASVIDPQAAADSRIRRRILSAENMPKKIRIFE